MPRTPNEYIFGILRYLCYFLNSYIEILKNSTVQRSIKFMMLCNGDWNS